MKVRFNFKNHQDAQKVFQEIMRLYWTDEITHDKYRDITYGMTVLLQFYKFDFESALITDHEERIRELEEQLAQGVKRP